MAEPNKSQHSLGENILDFVKGIFSLKNSLNKQDAREAIQSSISFKGMSSYVLMASVMIASIGLNANSVAVVIGAMLISPLMGPILGMGYSVAVNDLDTLKRSLVNFAIMIALALGTSFVYFSLIPLSSLNEQLRGRIEPTFLDVLIALFGGFAGIAALSGKSKNANVIAGVAIATALMPPLCTAGFGLSKGMELIGYKGFTGFRAAFNALYLFFINSVFIGVSTYAFIKLTRFPLAKYQNAQQAKRTNFIIVSIAILTMIPSFFIFYGILKDEFYKNRVQTFLSEQVAAVYEGAFFNLNNPVMSQRDSVKIVAISTLSEHIPETTVKNWNTILHKKYNLPNTQLVVHQGATDPNMLKEQNNEIMLNLYREKDHELAKKDSVISELKSQVNRLNSDTIPFRSISNELKSLYPELEYFGYAVFNSTNFKNEKTLLPTFVVMWKTEPETEEETEERAYNQSKLKNYLKSRLKLDTIQFVRY